MQPLRSFFSSLPSGPPFFCDAVTRSNKDPLDGSIFDSKLVLYTAQPLNSVKNSTESKIFPLLTKWGCKSQTFLIPQNYRGRSPTLGRDSIARKELVLFPTP